MCDRTGQEAGTNASGDNTGHSAFINTHEVFKNCRLLRSVLFNAQVQSSGTNDSFPTFCKTAQSCGKRHSGLRTSGLVLGIFGSEFWTLLGK